MPEESSSQSSDDSEFSDNERRQPRRVKFSGISLNYIFKKCMNCNCVRSIHILKNTMQ